MGRHMAESLRRGLRDRLRSLFPTIRGWGPGRVDLSSESIRDVHLASPVNECPAWGGRRVFSQSGIWRQAGVAQALGMSAYTSEEGCHRSSC